MFVNRNMSTPSLSSGPARRVPVQGRSERRVAAFLAHAESVIAEMGYEAATMTEIAARAKASIGSLYQYFPNKEAITVALFRRFANDLLARWATLTMEADHLDADALGARIIEQFVEFSNEQPAFFKILNAPVDLRKDPAARHRLREQFAVLFEKKNPALSKAEALQAASVALQTVKGLIELSSEVRAKDRPGIVAEHKILLSAYLSRRLSTGNEKAALASRSSLPIVR
jgi:AcrR family transcriptional regulator